MKKTSWQSILVVSFMLVAGACATSQTKEDAPNTDAVPTADAPATDAVPQAAPADTNQQAQAAVPAPAEQAPSAQAAAPAAADGGTDSYTVKSGDTLMRIAYETLGDLYKWREIYEANKDKISDPNKISNGMILKINKSGGAADQNHNGEKYLIKEGDTLGTISDSVYGTKTRWKELWENNKQLIHDPNKIFAGFYLYYIAGGGGQSAAASSDAGVAAKAVDNNPVTPSQPTPAPEASAPANNAQAAPAAPGPAGAVPPAAGTPDAAPADLNAPPSL